MTDELLYQMQTHAATMRIAGKIMAMRFDSRHQGDNFANASKHRRRARRKLAVAAKQYLDSKKAGSSAAFPSDQR